MLFKKITMIALLPIATLVLAGCETTQSMETAGEMAAPSKFTKDVFNLEEITCWDMATLSEDDASYAATMLYGYAMGKRADAKQSPERLEAALGEISKTCAGNPDMAIIDGFK